jgi:hypothetical protein
MMKERKPPKRIERKYHGGQKSEAQESAQRPSARQAVQIFIRIYSARLIMDVP